MSGVTFVWAAGIPDGLGERIATTLLSWGEKVRIMSRHAEILQSLRNRGADVSVGNHRNIADLAAALAGVDSVIVWIPFMPQERDVNQARLTFAQAACTAIRASSINAATLVSARSGQPVTYEYRSVFSAVEEQLAGSLAGRPLTILRVGLLFDSWCAHIDAVRSGSPVFSGLSPHCRIDQITYSDLSALVSMVSMMPCRDYRRTVEVYGRELKSVGEVVHSLSGAAQHRIAYVQLPHSVYATHLMAKGYSFSASSALARAEVELHDQQHNPNHETCVCALTTLAEFSCTTFTEKFKAGF